MGNYGILPIAPNQVYNAALPVQPSVRITHTGRMNGFMAENTSSSISRCRTVHNDPGNERGLEFLHRGFTTLLVETSRRGLLAPWTQQGFQRH